MVQWRIRLNGRWRKKQRTNCFRFLFTLQSIPEKIEFSCETSSSKKEVVFLHFLKRTIPECVKKEVFYDGNKLVINSKNLTKCESLALLTLFRYFTVYKIIVRRFYQFKEQGVSDEEAFFKSHILPEDNGTISPMETLIPYSVYYGDSYKKWNTPGFFPKAWKRLRTVGVVGDWRIPLVGRLNSTFYGITSRAEG